MAATVPGTQIEYAPGGGPDKRCYRVTCAKIRNVLPAFQPQWTAAKGAQELCDAYRSAEFTEEDFMSGRYFRIDRIRRLLQAGQLSASLHWTPSTGVEQVTVPESREAM